MRNIISIFLSDMRRISSNVVAVVIVIGLSVIPCLYAWFNIFSNWDPYGPDSTKNITVAVASEDEGVDIKDEKVNIGDIVLSKLEGNKSINWVVLKHGHKAVEGVTSGKYYAAFVIRKDFSANLVSFIGGDVKHPEIQYYENDKKNAIAPKITGKVKTAIQGEINHAFVQVLAKSALSVTAEIGSNEYLNGTKVKSSGIFDRTNEDLDAMVSVIDSYINLSKTASGVIKAAKSISGDVDELNKSIDKVRVNAQEAVDTASTSIKSLDDLIDLNFTAHKADLSAIKQKAEIFYTAVTAGSVKSNSALEKIRTLFNKGKQGFDTIRRLIKKLGIPTAASVSDAADRVDSDLTSLDLDIAEIETFNTALPKDAKAFYDACTEDIERCEDDLEQLKDAYKNKLSPVIETAVKSAKDTVTKAVKALNFGDADVGRIVEVLNSYPDMISSGPEKLKAAKENILKIKEKLKEVEDRLEGFKSAEQYSMLMKLLKTDPDAVAEFVTSPVLVKTKELFPYENNGSAMSPFYIVLSIWVGSLIMVAIIHTRVKDDLIERKFNHVEEFFGRYLVFFFIGQIQTIITVVGALLFVGIQCEHPLLLLVAMSFTSFVFTILNYALTFAFGAVGEAVIVVVMVLQVAGSGGTFPVDVLPDFYNMLYKYMPFVYSTNAAKEAIAGTYGSFYADNLMVLFIYVGVALIIGLLLSVPCKKLINYIKESTEKTDLIV